MIVKGTLTILFLVLFVACAHEDNSYLEPPKLIENPGSTLEHSPENRKFTGIPSLAISPGGRMWAIWYTGPTRGEDQNNYAVVTTSGDHGQTWQEVLAIDPDGDGPVRAYDPEIWIDPDGQLWIFWSQTIGRAGTVAGVWTMVIDDPDQKNPVWPAPRRLTDGVMMCKPTILSGGEWVLPVSFWHLKDGSAAVVVSDDHGKTWNLRGAATVPEEARNYDEHMIIEKKDGTLWMLVRTIYGIGESTSADRGRTWSTLVPSEIEHPHARFFIRRLNSGNLLLVKHGPIDLQFYRKQREVRSHLTAYLSMDEGKTWTDGLLLDHRSAVSYPDGQQTEEGAIYIIYDHNRVSDQEILITRFSEDDVVKGSYWEFLYTPSVADTGPIPERMLVSKGGVNDDP